MSTQKQPNEVGRLVRDLSEAVSGLPEPMASTSEEGVRLSHEIIGRYLPNLGCLLARIALGEECKSLHTRWQATQCALALSELAPDSRGSSSDGQRSGE